MICAQFQITGAVKGVDREVGSSRVPGPSTNLPLTLNEPPKLTLTLTLFLNLTPKCMTPQESLGLLPNLVRRFSYVVGTYLLVLVPSVKQDSLLWRN